MIPQVSVVIPSYNSTRTIRPCLRALLSQQTRWSFEIIVVDSSSDGADQIIAAEFPQVCLHHFSERRSVGAARNIGVEKARGEVILFLDTDCIAGPAWIDQMVQGIHNLEADGVGGALGNGTPGSLSGSIGYYLEFFRFLPYSGQPYPTFYLVGGNCGFERQVFDLARYTDQSVGDDLSFNWQLIQQGKRLWFLPSVAVSHLNKTGLSTVLRYQYKLGEGACRYRGLTSPKLMRFLKRLPVAVFFMPLGILPMIAAVILKRRGVAEFLKFMALLPLALAVNGVWALGFYRQLIRYKNAKAGTWP
jgi:glycosyltransferase involved in cell wall biosynthesis